MVTKLRSVNVILGHDPFQRRLDHLDWSRRDHIKLKVVPNDSRVEDAMQHPNVFLQPDALADFVKMFRPHSIVKFRVVQEQVRELSALLHQVELCHARGLTLELLAGNPQQFGEHVA